MKLFTLILIIHFSIKSISYSLYELNINKNKPAGIVSILLTSIGFILPIILLFKYY